jgi:hypothetical protein
MFTIKDIKEIRDEIINGKNQIINFSKTVNFPFSELYKEIVTKIKTIEISSKCILYDFIYAMNISKAYSDADYWNKDTDKDNIKNYWFIGQDTQGDYWIMDENGKVYFYNHDNDDGMEKIIDLNIDFEKWLQYAYLNKELDKIYYENKYNKNIGKEYMRKLKEISKELCKNYPFELK